MGRHTSPAETSRRRLRGTRGSNPACSSAESANHRFLSSRQAITCAGTYQRLQGRRVAADTAIWHRKLRDNGRRFDTERSPLEVIDLGDGVTIRGRSSDELQSLGLMRSYGRKLVTG